MAQSLSHPVASDEAEVAGALARAEAAILASGKAMGGIPKAGDDAVAMFARGYRVVVSNSDVLMLRDSARAEVEALGPARG